MGVKVLVGTGVGVAYVASTVFSPVAAESAVRVPVGGLGESVLSESAPFSDVAAMQELLLEVSNDPLVQELAQTYMDNNLRTEFASADDAEEYVMGLAHQFAATAPEMSYRGAVPALSTLLTVCSGFNTC